MIDPEVKRKVLEDIRMAQAAIRMAMGAAPEKREPPASYTIDVCRTCGAHATWPFACGHKPTGYVAPDAPSWVVPLRVRAAPGERERLRREMEAS